MRYARVKLKEIASRIQYGYTASASDEEVGPKLLRITDIVPDQIDWQSVPFCPIEDRLFEKYALHRGDIVIARTGNTTGYAKLIRDDQKAVFASYLVRVQLDEKRADPGYVGRIVESDIYKRFINSQKGGAAQGNANAQVLTLFEFDLPTLDVQRKIANVLSAYDDLLLNNLRRMVLLESAMGLLYREWFVRFRFPGYKHIKVINGVPEGWSRKSLGELANIVMGQSPESKFYNEEGEGLPFHQGVVDFSDRFVNNRVFTTAQNRIAIAEDILCSVRAPVGRLNITLEKVVIGRGLAALRSMSNNQSFMFYQLKTHFFKEDLIGSGAIFASVTKTEFENQRLLTPSNQLINAFEEFSIPIDKQLRALFLQNLKLKTARNLLLPRLMNGEILV